MCVCVCVFVCQRENVWVCMRERVCMCVRERENVCERERERECVMLRESLIDLILDDVPLLSILVFSFYLLEFFSRFGPKSIIIMFWAHT